MNRTIAFVFLIFIFSQVADAQLSVRPTGIFSNMQAAEDGGLVGTEIFVTYSRGDYHALVQHSKYGLNLVVLVKATVQEKKINFEVPFDSTVVLRGEGGAEQHIIIHNLWQFEGELSDDRLVGRFNDWETMELKRGKSYWQ